MTTSTEPATERWLGRRGAIHIVESGRDERAAGLRRSLGANCRQIVTRTFANCETAYQFEVLVLLAGADGYTCCLHARPSTDTPGTAEPQPIYPAIDSTETIARAAQDLLPELYGVETGDLWLGPLMSAYVLTDRAVETTADWSLSTDQSPIHALDRWAREHDRAPLLVQLLIGYSSTPPYEVTLRVMQLTERPPTDRQALGRLLDDGIVSPLDGLDTDEISSTRQLAPAEWETQSVPTPPCGSTDPYPELGAARFAETIYPPKAVRAREALTSHVEAQGLWNAATLSSHYEPFDAAPQLTVAQPALTQLLEVFPLPRYLRFDGSEWLGRPRFARDEVYREPSGTDRTALLPSPETSGWRRPTHDRRALDTIQRWLGLDDQAVLTTETPIGQPHLRDGSPVVDGFVVVVDQAAPLTTGAVGTAGELVAIANQAVRKNVPLWVLATDTASGEWALDVLRTPFQTTHRATGEPYLLPKQWVIDGRIIPLVDPDHSWGWRVTPTGRWLFWTDDEVRASGSVGTLTDQRRLSLPRLVDRGDSFEYVSADGEPGAWYDSVTAVENKRPIPQPVGPRWPTFAGYATILTVGTAGLRPHWERPEWHEQFPTKPRSRYLEAAACEFVATRTVERQGDAPPASDVRQWFRQYYCGQTDYDLGGLWTCDLENLLSVRVRQRDDGNLVLPSRAWAFPPEPGDATPLTLSHS